MTPALYILNIVDDFGNQICPCDLTSLIQRYNFFMDNWHE